MTERGRGLSRRQAIVDALAVVAGIGAIGVYVLTGTTTFFVIGAYGLLLGTSTLVVTYSLLRFTGLAVRTDNDETGRLRTSVWQMFSGRMLQSDAEEDTGWLIGRLENVLVLTLVLVGEYTALSIIFAAKSWVRYEDTASRDSTYYLAGTLVNFTYSIVIGLATVRMLG